METVNHEYYIDLEIAKLIEKVGFDWKTFGYYNKLRFFHRAIPQHGETPAPTLDLVQRWLREVKGYIVLVNYNEFLKSFYYSICYTKNTNRYIDDRDDCRNTSFEEAQKAGIKKALKLLLEKGE